MRRGLTSSRSRSSRRTEDRNLYKIWNRLSSGSYFPPPVQAVEIPKAGGKGVRVLGVPTVADRIAQTVVRLYLEPKVEPIFHPDSYGYRPGRSALDAVGVCRQRCWRSGLGDRYGHPGVLRHRALGPRAQGGRPSPHRDQQWIVLYVRRWLEAPLQRQDGAPSATPAKHGHAAAPASPARPMPALPGLLLHADREPQSPREWEQWLTATRKAIRKHAVTVWGQTRRTNASPTAHTRPLPPRTIGGARGSTPLQTAHKPSGLA